jgi:hypothetical protein
LEIVTWLEREVVALCQELKQLSTEFLEKCGKAASARQDQETTTEMIIDIHGVTILRRADWELDVDNFLVDDGLFPGNGAAP